MGLSEELLARGYLPKELPPSFSSSDFAGASSSLKATPPQPVDTACSSKSGSTRRSPSETCHSQSLRSAEIGQ
jgi:hypothetical protein